MKAILRMGAVALLAAGFAATASAQFDDGDAVAQLLVDGPRGAFVVEREVEIVDGELRGIMTAIGPHGGAWSRDFTRRWDPETRTLYGQGVLTTPLGTEAEAQWTARLTEPGLWEIEGEVRGPLGAHRITGTVVRVE